MSLWTRWTNELAGCPSSLKDPYLLSLNRPSSFLSRMVCSCPSSPEPYIKSDTHSHTLKRSSDHFTDIPLLQPAKPDFQLRLDLERVLSGRPVPGLSA